MNQPFPELKQTYYSESEVDNMSRAEMTSIVKLYNHAYSSFDDNKIQKVTLQDF